VGIMVGVGDGVGLAVGVGVEIYVGVGADEVGICAGIGVDVEVGRGVWVAVATTVESDVGAAVGVEGIEHDAKSSARIIPAKSRIAGVILSMTSHLSHNPARGLSDSVTSSTYSVATASARHWEVKSAHPTERAASSQNRSRSQSKLR
jgi:hypothetical protein